MVEPTKQHGAANGGGLVLIVLGIFFLLGQFFDWNRLGIAWPFFIIVPGLLFFIPMFAGGRSAAGLAIPGSIITTIGLILLYQETFDRFESWAYIWALIPTAVGVGIVIDGRWRGDAMRVQRGSRLAMIGLALFAAGFIFFELLVNISGTFDGVLGGTVVPLVLIGAGIFLFLRNPRWSAFGRPVTTDNEAPAIEQHEDTGPST